MENIRNPTSTAVVREQYAYRREQQKRDEDVLRNALIKKQIGWNRKAISHVFRFRVF